MTDEKLKRANFLKEEIRELDCFIHTASCVWTGKIIKRTSQYIFKSNAYGVFDEAEFPMNTTIKNRVLDVLKDYKNELEKELEEM